MTKACVVLGCDLGMLGDDPDRLMAAVAYLLQHQDILKEAGL